FSYTLLRHVEANSIPNFGITLAGFFMGAGLVLFVIFLDRSIHRLRPVAVAALVAEAGRRALREVLSEATRPDAPDILPAPFDVPGGPALTGRIMVDIAIRALSPAVNDPTTAVQVLDHLEDVLREIGTTHLVSNEERTGPRHHGVVVPVRRWDDYLTLGVTEIREYGGNSVQVMRRLRAMLEELHDSVDPERGAVVERELTRLDAAVAEHWGGTV